MNAHETTSDHGDERLLLDARRIAFHSPDGLLAFGFGSGLVSRAPGTMGTLAAVPLAPAVLWLGGDAFWLLWLGLFLLGVWLCGRVTERLGVDDYGGIVWDEMVGFWLVVSWVPPHWAWWLAAFVLFRFFDIVKPWPISRLETAFAGGLGIMLDDAAAGLYAAILLAGVERGWALL